MRESIGPHPRDVGRAGWVRMLCLVSALVAAASSPALAKKSADAARESQADQPFIVETRVVVPKRVGEFVLEGTQYTPEQKYAGVQIRYEHPDHAQIRFDFFVYPAGKMPNEEALRAGMKDFRDSFQAGMRLGYYRDFEIVDDAPFEIALPKAVPPQATPPASPSKSEADAKAEPVADAPAGASDDGDLTPGERELASDEFLESLKGRPLKGERLRLKYVMTDDARGERIPMRSRGYLFYRHLYYFKARISAAESQIDEAAFSALADRAVRELVPAIQARNIGACGQMTLYIDPSEADENKQAEAMAQSMMDALLSRSESNCDTRIDEKEFAARHADAEVVTIAYDPDDWGDR